MAINWIRTYKSPSRLLLCVLFCMICNLSFSNQLDKAQTKDQKKAIQDKISFILKIATNVTPEKKSDTKTYKIGIYGRTDDAKLLYSTLKSGNYSVNGKLIEAQLIKYKLIQSDVQLMYVHYENQNDLIDLKKKQPKQTIFVTEGFPFGKSMINFSINAGKLSYELQELNLENQNFIIGDKIKTNNSRVATEIDWGKKLKEANETIKNREKTINGQREAISSKEKEIAEKSTKISTQQDNIQLQTEEIKANKALIKEQNKVIVSIAIGVIVSLLLIAIMFNINKKRRQALILNEQKTKEILSSITYSKRIQNAFLPSNKLLNQTLKDGFIIYEPKDIVSGDFYWMEVLNGTTYFAVADCTGHGVPGALLSTLCSNTLTRAVNELNVTDPGKILDTCVLLLSEFFSKSGELVHDGMDIALCSFTKKTRVLKFAGANRPLLHRKYNGELIEIKGDRQPIGYYEKRTQYTTHTIQTSNNDTIYMYSDGIVDQFGGENDKKYGTRRLKELISSTTELDMNAQKVIFETNFNQWRDNNERNDDSCFLAVKMTS